jgi:DUF1365 family protein
MQISNHIYKGNIRHRRYTPFSRKFQYSTFMTYFDINMIETLFNKSIFWNTNKRAVISFYREDYHGDKNISLDKAVRNTVLKKTGKSISGPIRILTHLRYFGYCFNPVSFYYCYDKEDSNVELIMAEVTNTPWNERHCYFITNKKHKNFKQNLKKKLHVSPFWDMDHDYQWYFSVPRESLNVNMINYKDSKKVFDATLTLTKKSELNVNNLLLHSLRFPFITLIVFLRIHFQAMKLWIKGATFFDHPKYEENN